MCDRDVAPSAPLGVLNPVCVCVCGAAVGCAVHGLVQDGSGAQDARQHADRGFGCSRAGCACGGSACRRQR
jgi:hypothetical protein